MAWRTSRLSVHRGCPSWSGWLPATRTARRCGRDAASQTSCCQFRGSWKWPRWPYAASLAARRSGLGGADFSDLKGLYPLGMQWSYGKSPCLREVNHHKSSMKGSFVHQFSIAILNNQRVTKVNIAPINAWFMLDPSNQLQGLSTNKLDLGAPNCM